MGGVPSIVTRQFTLRSHLNESLQLRAFWKAKTQISQCHFVTIRQNLVIYNVNYRWSYSNSQIIDSAPLPEHTRTSNIDEEAIFPHTSFFHLGKQKWHVLHIQSSTLKVRSFCTKCSCLSSDCLFLCFFVGFGIRGWVINCPISLHGFELKAKSSESQF